MNVASNILSKINRLPLGYVFTYDDFELSVKHQQAVIKALNRLVQKGEIAKLSKGRFYKPEKSVFGKLLPDQYQIVKDYLEKDGQLIGYLTGYSIYNELGLTTQVSNVIQIGRKDYRPSLKRDRYTVRFIVQLNTINKENIPYLQLLDCIRFIKRIPDAPINQTVVRLIDLMRDYKTADVKRIIRLSLEYAPSTRALLGGVLDKLGFEKYTNELMDSLNPVTVYNFKGLKEEIIDIEKWKIE